MVTVNAGGLAEGVFESELFGHVKGAFTDAKTDRVGRFELADGGTLFLDEIANVPMNLQAKMLRVLEVGEMERVGSSKTKRVDVRVISATNAHLDEEVQFRTLSPGPAIPAEHHRDSSAAAAGTARGHSAAGRAFSGRARAALSQTHRRVRSRGMQLMLEHPWQGNVRELNHVIERAVLMAQDSQIKPADLALRSGREGSSAPGGHEHRGSGGVPHQEGAGALQRQRQPRRQCSGPEPQRAVSPSAARIMTRYGL